MSEHWLECTVEEGMFSDEKVVGFTTLTGQSVSFFVPTTAIEDHRVKVKVIKEGDHFLVVLPNEAQSIVPVKERDFVAA